MFKKEGRVRDLLLLSQLFFAAGQKKMELKGGRAPRAVIKGQSGSGGGGGGGPGGVGAGEGSSMVDGMAGTPALSSAASSRAGSEVPQNQAMDIDAV